MEREFHRWLKQDSRQAPRQRSRAVADLQATAEASLVAVGIGDDAAVLRFWGDAASNGDRAGIVLTTDAIAEGTHFDLSKHSLQLVGRKSLAVNLSDLAAMGAEPVAALLTLMIPRRFSLADVQEIFIGCQTLATEFNLEIVGGDTNSWDGPLLVSVTAIGRTIENAMPAKSAALAFFNNLASENVWRMDQAQAGDAIVVSGCFGGSIHGHHLSFQPRVALARYLISRYKIHAATDASDSLSFDLSAMAAASNDGEGLGVEIEIDMIPISAAAQMDADDATALNRALTDGEDFELILAMENSVWEVLQNDPQLPCSLTRIGCFVEGNGFRLLHPDGRLEKFQPRGYSH